MADDELRALLAGLKLKPEVKICVIDTNVLLHNPQSLLDFDDNVIVIPDRVIEELDEMKKGTGEIPYSAREVLRILNSIQEEGKSRGENIIKGIKLSKDGKPTGGILMTYEAKDNYFRLDKPDNWIVSAAKEINDANKDNEVLMISKDVGVRLKAESKGIKTGDYTQDKTTVFDTYGKILGEDDYNNGILSVRYQVAGNNICKLYGKDLSQVIKRHKSVWGIEPKNIGQECAINALTDPTINVVALTGVAGTGKTLLALASALHQTTKSSPMFKQVLVARPIVPMGNNDLGFLPGDINEKLAPWMQPILDNLEVLVSTSRDEGKDGSKKEPNYQYLIENGTIHMEPLAYIRGRSLPERYIIIDEAQNLRPLDVKTLITRCGEGTKIVFTGDLKQIDTPFLDAQSSGLAYLISRYINEEDFCYLNLTEGARSSMAAKAALLL